MNTTVAHVSRCRIIPQEVVRSKGLVSESYPQLAHRTPQFIHREYTELPTGDNWRTRSSETGRAGPVRAAGRAGHLRGKVPSSPLTDFSWRGGARVRAKTRPAAGGTGRVRSCPSLALATRGSGRLRSESRCESLSASVSPSLGICRHFPRSSCRLHLRAACRRIPYGGRQSS